MRSYRCGCDKLCHVPIPNDKIRRLVHCINEPGPYLDPAQSSQDDIRIEAAHVIASLSYGIERLVIIHLYLLTLVVGSSEALKGLLAANAVQAFLFAIANFQPSDTPALRAAFARALRALAVAVADAVGPPMGGLQTHPSEARDEATVALNNLFEVLCALLSSCHLSGK